jgi:hypothetical protein
MMSVMRATHPSRLTALDMIKVSETPTAAQLNKFRMFYGTRHNNTTFTRACYGAMLAVKGIQSTVFSHLLHSL